MKLSMYQIDAFASKLFEGNPAAVCPLDAWIDERLMQAIANENNLSETVFFVKEANQYQIRWFTPTSEVDMCGHATLASAYVIFKYIETSSDSITFDSKSGLLHVRREDTKIWMDFPIQLYEKASISETIKEAFDIAPLEVYKSMDYLLIFDKCCGYYHFGC